MSSARSISATLLHFMLVIVLIHASFGKGVIRGIPRLKWRANPLRCVVKWYPTNIVSTAVICNIHLHPKWVWNRLKKNFKVTLEWYPSKAQHQPMETFLPDSVSICCQAKAEVSHCYILVFFFSFIPALGT